MCCASVQPGRSGSRGCDLWVSLVWGRKTEVDEKNARKKLCVLFTSYKSSQRGRKVGVELEWEVYAPGGVDTTWRSVFGFRALSLLGEAAMCLRSQLSSCRIWREVFFLESPCFAQSHTIASSRSWSHSKTNILAGHCVAWHFQQHRLPLHQAAWCSCSRRRLWCTSSIRRAGHYVTDTHLKWMGRTVVLELLYA